MIRFEFVNPAGQALAATIEKEQIPFEGEAIVFVGALGICVRRIVPLIHDKATDPAVVCVDITGRFVIPVLSGHIGGANELARQIALVTGGEAVVTTQSDRTGLWALDTLAREQGWGVSRLSRAEMNRIIATFVNRRPTALVLEWEDRGTHHLIDTCPPHVQLFSSYADFLPHVADYSLLLIVSPHFYAEIPGLLMLQYHPRVLSLGVGCQRQTPTSAADGLLGAFQQTGYAPEAVARMATVALKQDEPLVDELCRRMPWAEKTIYLSDELAKVEVPHPSERVQTEVGTSSVAEAAAQRASRGGRLVVEKQKGIDPASGRHFTFAVGIEPAVTERGHIEIVGAGPGDPDLVSVRGRHFLEQADLILYAGSLVPRALTACAKSGATVRSSAGMTLDEQFALMKDFYDRQKLVVRLHTGDPCIYGAIDEQMALFDRHGMDYHITPGISSFLAAAAELQSQLTLPGRCQTIILTRGEGRTPVPERERLRTLASHQSTLCIFLSASLVDQVQAELLEGGYPPETPVAACYRLTWPDQRVVRGQLKDLAHLVKNNGLTLTTMIVVGEAIGNREGQSLLYDAQFSHLFRKAETTERGDGDCLPTESEA